MFGQQPNAEREPGGDDPNKGSRTRFAEWVQTTQGIVSIIATVITLLGGAASTVFALNHYSPQPSSSPTRSPTDTFTLPNPSPTSSSPPPPSPSPPKPPTPSPTPSPSPTDYFNESANSTQLTRALLSPGVLGPTAYITDRGTGLSGLTAPCGDLIPNGSQGAAHEIVYDAQTSQKLEEAIIEWDSPRDAATLIANDHVALDQSGGCSFSAGGETFQWTGDHPGSVSSNCDDGQYIATQVSGEYPYGSGFAEESGFEAAVQCGRYTVTTVILDGNGYAATQWAANTYMNDAMAKLQEAIG